MQLRTENACCLQCAERDRGGFPEHRALELGKVSDPGTSGKGSNPQTLRKQSGGARRPSRMGSWRRTFILRPCPERLAGILPGMVFLRQNVSVIFQSSQTIDLIRPVFKERKTQPRAICSLTRPHRNRAAALGLHSVCALTGVRGSFHLTCPRPVRPPPSQHQHLDSSQRALTRVWDILVGSYLVSKVRPVTTDIWICRVWGPDYGPRGNISSSASRVN